MAHCQKCSIETDKSCLYCCICKGEIVEKCSKCGELEWTGSKMCKNEVNEAIGKLRSYQTRVPKYDLFALVLGLLVQGVFFLLLIADNIVSGFSQDIPYVYPFVVSFCVVMFIGYPISCYIKRSRLQETEKEFFGLQPEYAETIKKARELNIV